MKIEKITSLFGQHGLQAVIGRDDAIIVDKCTTYEGKCFLLGDRQPLSAANLRDYATGIIMIESNGSSRGSRRPTLHEAKILQETATVMDNLGIDYIQ